ncbi:MAG TPA: PsbP-related protein, partial [Phototrophicaceae bacterium]|nr:PsbP-related protein [Phototrophicaceae bacterium]
MNNNCGPSQFSQISKPSHFIGIIRVCLIITVSFAAVASLYPFHQQFENQHEQQAFATQHKKNYKDMDNHINQIPSETKPAASSEPEFDAINKYKNKSAPKTYQNPDHGIKIQYPSDWTFSEENGSIVKFGQQKYLQLDDGSFVAFYSPLESSNDTHLANLRVYSKDLPAEIEKLDGSSHLSLLDLYSVYFSHFLKYSNLTVVEPIAKTHLGADNKSAYQIQYASGDGKQKQQSMLDTFTIYNNKIYGLRYTSEPNEYSKHLQVVKTMVASFETMPREKQNEKGTGGTEPAREGPQISNKTATTDPLHETVTDNDNNNSNNGNSFAFDNSSTETHLDLLKNQTLAKINEDRQKFGLRPVNLSHNSAAQYQAENIMSTKYMSHLTTNGEKPYMLYSKMGGLGKVRQNVAFIGDPNFYAKCVSGEID